MHKYLLLQVKSSAVWSNIDNKWTNSIKTILIIPSNHDAQRRFRGDTVEKVKKQFKT